MNNVNQHDYKPATKAGLLPNTSAYASARTSLLLIAALTVVNIVLAFVGSDTYLLFSLTLPYYLVYFLLEMTGQFSAEYYMDVYGTTELEFWPEALLYIGLVIAVIVIAIYVVLYVLSKKHPTAYLVATIFFGIDTLILLGYALLGGFVYFLIDIAIHGVIIYLLIKGIIAGYKAKTELAAAEAMAAAAPVENEPIAPTEETLSESAPEAPAETASEGGNDKPADPIA